jgi:hypothetical protein
MDFPFHEVYQLDDYNDNDLPSVFFGLYRYEDKRLAFDHHAQSVLFWTGQDSMNFDDWEIVIDSDYRVSNVTAHPKVYKEILSKGASCQLVKPAPFLRNPKPQKLGKKIYAYCPSSAPDYHGVKILNQLSDAGYEIVIGDGQYSQKEWISVADLFYNDIFIGLCLSEFAGGGLSIIEMGLRGISVVTNVFDLPNCIPWESVEDVMLAIELESKNIGTINNNLSQGVWNNLDHKHEWLHI